MVGDRPAHHDAAEGVENDGQVDLALGGGVLGDVHHPQRSGPAGSKARFTRSSAGSAAGSRRVQPRRRRR